MARFKYIEYEGDNADDVLVSLLMNMEAHRDSRDGDHDKRPTTTTERSVGFQPNPEVRPMEPEDE